MSTLKNHWKKYLYLLIVIGLIVWWFQSCQAEQKTAGKNIAELEGSVFYHQFMNEDKITKIALQNEVIVFGEYQNQEQFITYLSLDLFPELKQRLQERVKAKELEIILPPGAIRDSGGRSIWSILFPFFIFFLIYLVISFVINVARRRAQSNGNGAGLFGFGKSGARVSFGQETTTFDDVAGVDEAKQELQEVVDFLKNREKYVALGARIPKGVLLMGPPGTGKTLLARAVAGESKAPFLSISASEFVEMFVGVGASRVRDLFDQAKKFTSSIIFIDEIDAVGGRRTTGPGMRHEEREQTLQQILTEMDGFDINTNVIVIAATNRPEELDPALLRPGRFDRRVILDRPDIDGRIAILRVHIKNKPVEAQINLQTIAKLTAGFTGADLENLVNEAAILAAKREKKEISMQELEECVDKVSMGPERKSKKISPEEKKITAYHEAGHALVASKLKNTDPVHKISIVARGMAGGYTRILSEERSLLKYSQLKDMLASLFGGYAAEELIFKEPSTGASNDLERATEISHSMITEYGMSEILGPRTFGRRQRLAFLDASSEERNYSEKVAQLIDAEIGRMTSGAHQAAQEILKEHQSRLVVIAECLIAQETIEGEELAKLLTE